MRCDNTYTRIEGELFSVFISLNFNIECASARGYVCDTCNCDYCCVPIQFEASIMMMANDINAQVRLYEWAEKMSWIIVLISIINKSYSNINYSQICFPRRYQSLFRNVFFLLFWIYTIHRWNLFLFHTVFSHTHT